MPGVGVGAGIGKTSLGTKLNLYPPVLDDGNTVAWYDRSNPQGVEKDINGVESIYWDLMVGKEQRSAEQASGNIIVHAVYEITATQTDFFYTGCAVGDIFPCGVVKTCNANNKVKRVLGNHLTQPVVAQRPINGVFDGVNDFMRTAPFTLIQPETLYPIFQLISSTANACLVDGGAIYTGLLQENISQYLVNPNEGWARINSYAGVYLTDENVNTHLTNGSLALVKYTCNGSSSKIKVGGNKAITGNIGASNMNGITLGANGNGVAGACANILFKELIVRKIADSEENDTSISTYAKKKYKLRTFSILGDSTVSFANGGTDWHPVSSMLSHNCMRLDFSAPGSTIALQKTALINCLADDIDCVIIQIGLNDLLGTSATLIAAFQDLVNTARTKIGSTKKIIVSTMIPCNRATDQQWIDLNEAILGSGATPITGADGRVNTVSTALNDGSNGLATAYDFGDGVHPNDLGRQIIADLWDAKLTELGL